MRDFGVHVPNLLQVIGRFFQCYNNITIVDQLQQRSVSAKLDYRTTHHHLPDQYYADLIWMQIGVASSASDKLH